MTTLDHSAASTGSLPVPAMASIRAWLWSVAALVFLMVMVGGATRLTESGLSITEWKPVLGVLPPLNEAAWVAEFEKYKQIPQYAKLFPTMSLDEFKVIFFWEWGHRLLGRIIGLAFALPLAWFWLRGALTTHLKWQLTGLLLLGGMQGAVGWWMVKSGLVDRVEVAPERLAVHLLLASLTFTALVWLAVSLKPARAEPEAARNSTGALTLVWMVLAQIGLGALVAGSRAGYTYNTWPLMDGKFVPPLENLFRQEPWWINFLENITTIQFEHRMFAYVVLVAGLIHAWRCLRLAPGTKAAKRSVAVAALISTQALIGIVTLLLQVPLWAGLLHQAFAMVVLGMAVVHARRCCEA